jgi:hypothetical protein
LLLLYFKQNERTKTTLMTQELPPQMQLMQLIFGLKASRAISVAAGLYIADKLKDGPKSTEQLAEEAGVHARSLYRVLRACASIGVFSEDGEKRFSLTPLAEPLLSDAPGACGPLLLCSQPTGSFKPGLTCLIV